MICSYCNLEMSDSIGCTWDETRILNEEKVCHDCLAPKNTLHHPGCDSERCNHTGLSKLDGSLYRSQKISCSECAEEQCEKEGHEMENDECLWCGYYLY